MMLMFLVKKILLILCLFSATIAQIATLEVSDETSYIFPDYIGDTIVVPINVELNQIDLYAAEIHLSSFQNNIEFEDIIFEGFLTGDNNWSFVINEQEQVLIIGIYGSQVINQDGSLLALKFSVPNDLEETLFSIQVPHIELNELSGAIDIANGEISINHLHFGDVTQNNDVSMMDAAEILRYLVGDVDLNNYQQVAADVTLDQSISALDASVIAQYAIGLIDTFSSLGNLTGTGELSVSNNLEYLPGEILEIPIILNSSDNFLSFEFEVSYDAEQLIYNDIEWSQLSTSFMLEQKFESGSIRLVGSSTTPVDVLGILAIIKMQVSQSVDEDYIDLVIEKMRVNELEPVFDVLVSVAQEVLSNDIVSVPSQYELYQNFPNPFNPTTEIRYALAELSDVVVSVYDLKGRLMKTLISQKQPAGLNKILWDGTDNVGKKVSAGMYLYTIEAGTFRKTKKMIMLN